MAFREQGTRFKVQELPQGRDFRPLAPDPSFQGLKCMKIGNREMSLNETNRKKTRIVKIAAW